MPWPAWPSPRRGGTAIRSPCRSRWERQACALPPPSSRLTSSIRARRETGGQSRPRGAPRAGVAAVALLLPRFPALPVEALIFTLASLTLVALVQGLRRARSTAQQAQQRAEEALRAAVEAVRVRDDLLTTVSHDLKNPLAAIK